MGKLGTSIDLYSPEAPGAPYLAVKLDGKIYDLEHNFIKSLNFIRQQDDFGQFELVLADTMDLSLEAKVWKLLLDDNQEISFQYGWYKGLRSVWHTGLITDYKPDFNPNFTAQLTLQGYISADPDSNQITAFEGNSISEIVEQVCANEGWPLVQLDKTDPFDKKRVFRQCNRRSIDFIREKLEPEATCNGTPVMFYLTNDADGPKAYFIKITRNQFVEVQNYNFMINSGNYGSVISFQPSYSGAGIVTDAKQQIGFIDIETNEVTVYNAEAQAAATQGTLNVYGSTSPDRMKALLANKWYQKNIGSYPATLTIVGNPSLEVGKYVNIMPMLPNGSIHHSGGTYLINEITDAVAGSYITTLTLTKISNSTEGATDPFSSVVKLSEASK